MYNKPQKLVAEFVGTFALIFFGAGSICADQFLRTGGQGSLGLLGIALAHGLAIGIMVTSLGHISGGHFNPAITIGFWVTRKLSTIDTLAYWVAQLAGAVVAAYLLRLLPVDVWTAARLGGPFTGAALNPARAFGPALAANHWTNHGVYWIGPLAGGVAAGWLYDIFFLKKE